MKLELIISVTDQEDPKQTEKEKREARELLDKIKKYGAFNDLGEWTE